MKSDLWRTLKVGDKVRVVHWPEELHEEQMHKETFELYTWLIDTQSVLTIVEIDAWGWPEGRICRVVNGVDQSEYIHLNHSGLEIVEVT
jgi:hypothetical protein